MQRIRLIFAIILFYPDDVRTNDNTNTAIFHFPKYVEDIEMRSFASRLRPVRLNVVRYGAVRRYATLRSGVQCGFTTLWFS